MNTILVCSYNPLLLKSLYGVLRAEGYAVDHVDHMAFAVQRAIAAPTRFAAVILDADTIGLTAEDAADIIIRATAEALPVIIVGGPAAQSPRRSGALRVERPIDMTEVKRMVRSACNETITQEHISINNRRSRG